MSVQHINPVGLVQNPAFTNVVVVSGAAKTVYIGGQDAVDERGNVIGIGDIKAQTEQVFKNLELALAAVGAGLENIIKWNIYVVQGQPIQPGFEVAMRVWGNRPNPPLITVVYVAGLVRPELLVEMDAIAVIGE